MMPLVSSLALMLVQMALTMYPQVPGEHSPPPPPLVPRECLR